MDPLRFAWQLWAGVAVLSVVLPLACSQAGVRATRALAFDCGALAASIERIASYRDMDANLGKVLAHVRRLNADLPAQQLEVIEREIRRLWAERLPASDAAFALYTRCQRQLGDMGREA